MPWCDACARYWSPNAMRPDGSCPNCEVKLATPRQLRSEARAMGIKVVSAGVPGEADAEGAGADAAAEVPAEKAPWHFKLLVGCVSVYLAWRLVQLIVATVHAITN